MRPGPAADGAPNAARESDPISVVEAEREPNFLLARWERPTRIWIARRLARDEPAGPRR